jgi:methionine aminotransferase
MRIRSKLPNTGTTIFTVMSALANQHGAINLSQGFPNFDCSELLKSLVHQHMLAGHNQYAPMTGVPQLRERIAAKIERLYAHAVDPATEVTVTAGATQAIFSAISAFVRPSDEVILLEPAYDSYRPSVELNGGVAIPYALTAPDYHVDWAAVGALVNPRTRMLIINTPHNPTGKTLSAQDLAAISGLLAGTDILLLSDEVYEHLIFDGAAHQSVLRFPALYERSLLTFSFGKTFHNTGWKVGYCVAPPALTAEFRKVHQFNVFAVNTPVQLGIADYLADPATYESLPAFYQQKRDFFLRQMEGSRFRPIKSEGTYFQLFDYSGISEEPDTAFAERLTIEHGVAVIPVSVFYSGGTDQRVVRVCFAKTEETLAQAAARLRQV